LVGGIDVNAAASTDPAAKFLLDLSFEKPMTGVASGYASPLWLSGYIRLASIAQPGAISGAADVATYISPLTASTPSTLVQSAEAQFTFEGKIPSSASSSPSSIHLIAGGGIITPLSPSQANPTPYQVDQALYNYYNNASATGIAAVAYQAITTACGSTFSATTPCYVAYVPQDRSRFYRNWSTGLTYREYTSNGNGYFFPNYLTLSVGQNEYVTAGMMRGFVLHAGGTFLMPGVQASKLAGALWLYGAIDMDLTHTDQSTQQFLLQTAPSTVTATGASVAVIPVAAQNRDRYRFGVALDISKLVSMLTAKN
jgi:hypothetical protein